jgi:hypothetical protein
MPGRRHRWLIAALPLSLFGGCFAKSAMDAAALSGSGYKPEFGSPTRYFGALARDGMSPAQVAAALQAPARVERYVAPKARADSVLVERYVYTKGLGRWAADIYYTRDGGVIDVYAQDAPALRGARPVTAAEAEAWRNPAER